MYFVYFEFCKRRNDDRYGLNVDVINIYLKYIFLNFRLQDKIIEKYMDEWIVEFLGFYKNRFCEFMILCFNDLFIFF